LIAAPPPVTIESGGSSAACMFLRLLTYLDFMPVLLR